MPRIAVGLLVRDGRVLLAHRHPSRAAFPNCWDFVGGHLEAGETARQALDREVREEIGVTVLAASALDLDLRTGPGLDITPFRVSEWDGDPWNAAPDEHDDLRWFTPDDLASVPLAHPAALGGIVEAARL